MKYSVVMALALFAFSSFAASEMKLKCEGHTLFKKRVCEIEVRVDTGISDSEGNLVGSGNIKCYERNGTIINQSSLRDFCYSGMANGNFLLEAQAETKPFEVPSLKATVKIDISSNSKKLNGLASYYNGSSFKEMTLKCEYLP